MGIITKEVEVKIVRNNVTYYKELGYDIPMKEASKSTKKKHKKDYVYDLGKTITVKVEDLQPGSNVKVQYLCDYCNENIITIVYADLTRRTKELNKMACHKCYPIKRKENVLRKQGITSLSSSEIKETMYKAPKRNKNPKIDGRHFCQTEEVKMKRHNTCVQKYGENYRKKFMDKAFKTFSDRTGYDYPSQSPDVREKMIQSYIDHYGVDNPQKSLEVRERTENTNFIKYGCKAPSQNPDISKKTRNVMYENNTCMTSKQQIYIYSLYKYFNNCIEINHPISYYSADIFVPDELIDIEIDFGGHDLAVKMGSLTQEEFIRKERIRDIVIRKEGCKIIRIISHNDFLPSDEVLLQLLSHSKEYFSNTYHTWISWNISESKMINAENKDANGVFFDFGKLRRIKKDELPSICCE